MDEKYNLLSTRTRTASYVMLSYQIVLTNAQDRKLVKALCVWDRSAILGLVKLETRWMVGELQGYLSPHLQSPPLSVKTKSKYTLNQFIS